MRHARYRLRELLRLAAIYAAALLTGVLAGNVWIALALASTGLVGWHYVRLSRMLGDVASRRRLVATRRAGAWDALERLFWRRQNELRTRRRRLVDLLRTYQRAAAALPDAIVILDRADDRIVWFNRAAARTLGLRIPQDVDARLKDAVASPHLANWLAAREREDLLELPSPLDPDQTLSLHPIVYNDDQWLLVARDVSRLMHLQKVRRDFVANVSHELRTPLTVVHGYLDMIEPEDHPELAGIVDEMRRQSHRMTHLVEDLLTLSRLEAQDALAEEETVAMRPLLDTLRREALALSQGRHRILVSDLCSHDLRGSTKELHSAFSNLISNAVRYTPTGGEIEVRYEAESDGGVRFAVRDSGHGIPSQHLARLTERFYRVSTSRSRDSGGTGLGLSIVKHVLALHQSQLEVSSRMGIGSVFSCRFEPERIVPRSEEAVNA